MSYHLKLFLVVTFGSVLALITVHTLINSTNDISETFSTSTTAYVAPDPNAIKRPEAIVREKSEIELQIEKERGALADAATQRQQERLSNEENNSLNASFTSNDLPENTADEDADEDADADQETDEETDEETEQDAEADEGKTGNSGSGNEPNRTDSDTDMREPTTEQAEAITDEQLNDSISIARSRDKNNLGEKKRVESVRALDLAYAPPAGSGCTFPDNNTVRVGVQYRQTSYAIKGQSLTNIDQLIRLYNKCGGGKMLVLQNNDGLKETEERLIQLRKDEVKYYLLQRRVPKDDMIFSDNS